MKRTTVSAINSYGSHLPTGGSVFGAVQKSDRACRGQKEGHAGQMDRCGRGHARSQDKIHHYAAKTEGRGKDTVYPAPKEDHIVRPWFPERLPGTPRTGNLLRFRYGGQSRQRVHKGIQPGL